MPTKEDALDEEHTMRTDSFENFLWDHFLRSFRDVDALYENTAEWDASKRRQFLKRHGVDEVRWKDIYNSRIEYLRKNVSLVHRDKRAAAEDSYFHSKFGWVLAGGGIKAYLGKCTLFGNIQMEIGMRSYFSGHGLLRGKGLLRIGNYCSVAEEVYANVEPDFHPMTFPATYNFRENMRLRMDELSMPMQYGGIFEAATRGVTIGHDVWIGRNVRIFHGVKIADGCCIAENSLVRNDCEPYGVYGGIPAKLIRFRCPDRIIQQLVQIQWWHWPIDRIRRNRTFFDTDLDNFNGDLEDLIEEYRP
jgi:virginiamycin A acetyltransferase